jgi:hypothetical protein
LGGLAEGFARTGVVDVVVWDTGVNERAPTQPEAAKPEDDSAQMRRMLGFEPDARQKQVLESRSTRGVLNCTRQWGKSTITAAKAVMQAWGEKDSLTLVVKPQRTAERRVSAEGGGTGAAAGSPDERGRRQ